MTSLDHNRSRFGFSATRARLPVPRARLDRHDETSWTRPPSEEQPRVGFQSGLTPVIHRHESHTPPNNSIQKKSFAAAQPPWRQLDQPDPEEGACSPSWHWRCRCPVRLSRVGVGSTPAVFMRHLASGIGLCGAVCVQRSGTVLTPMIHPRRLLGRSCRLHSLHICTHLHLLLAARLLGHLLIHYHRLSAASCFSAWRNGEQGAAPRATTLP